MKFIRLISFIILMLTISQNANAQDNKPLCLVRTCKIANGVQWSNGNQTWIFKPLTPENSIYIFIHNNNPTTAHTSQIISVYQTPAVDAADLNLTASDLWTQDNVIQNTTGGAQCNNVNARVTSSAGASGIGTCYATTLFASQVAIKITGAAGAAGTPDTFDIYIVQSPGEPKSQRLDNSGSHGSSTSALQAIAEGFSTAYVTQSGVVTNPAINKLVLGVLNNTSTRTIYYDSVTVYCNAACTITIIQIINNGSLCAQPNSGNLRLGDIIASHASTALTLGFSCTTEPTQGASGASLSNIPILANTLTVIDLRGFIANNGTTQGLGLFMSAALTGTIQAFYKWYER